MIIRVEIRDYTNKDGLKQVRIMISDDVKNAEAEDYGLCPTCHEHLDGEESECETCNGSGYIPNKKSGIDFTIAHCDNCKGTGNIMTESSNTLYYMIQRDIMRDSIRTAQEKMLMYMSDYDRQYYKLFLKPPHEST